MVDFALGKNDQAGEPEAYFWPKGNFLKNKTKNISILIPGSFS